MIAAIFISYMALLNSVISSPEPLFPTDGTAGGPVPVNGLWALEKADCPAPTSLDLTTWPKCATPLGFLDDEVAALERPGPGKKATADQFYAIARTRFQVARAEPNGGARFMAPPPAPPSDPAASAPSSYPAPTPAFPAAGPVSLAVVQIDIPLFLSHTFVYLALSPSDADPATGRFTRSTAWAIVCPKYSIAGVAFEGQGCSATTSAGVRGAAALAAADPAASYRLFRVDAAAPDRSPPSDTVAPNPSAPYPPNR